MTTRSVNKSLQTQELEFPSAKTLEFVVDERMHNQDRIREINPFNMPDVSISYAVKTLDPRKKLIVSVNTDDSLLQ